MRFPTWKEVESDSEFQSLEPTKKKEYFGKWSRTAVDRAMQQGLYRDEEFASGFTGWYNKKAKEYGDEEEFGDFQQLSTRLRKPPKVGTSILEEITQIPAALKSSFDQPLEAYGETAEVLGAPALGKALKESIDAPKDYKPAAESFMRPEKGEFQVMGYAPQYLPRAIAEQTGQLGMSIVSRIGGGAIGGLIGSAAGPAGTIAGAAAGQFAGPAIVEMGQIVGPVAKERAKNNGRTEPNNEDLAWAWTTAGTSGALNAIGAKYLPGGDKLVGNFAQNVAKSFFGEFATETPQAFAQQIGETVFTEKGLEVSPKEAFGEGFIGGGAGASAVVVSSTASKIIEKANRKPEDPAKAAATKAAAEDLAKANQTAQTLSENNAPLTAQTIQTNAAKDFSKIAETEENLEEIEKFAPPASAITTQELKAQYSTFSDKDLADTEATFQEDLASEDPETRSFAQSALNAIAEVKAEKSPVRKAELPTDALPIETPAATYGREEGVYDVFADVRRQPLPPSGPAFESAQVIEQELARAETLRQSPEGRAQLRRELQGEQMTGEVRRAVEQALATTPEVAEEGDVFAVSPVSLTTAEPTPTAVEPTPVTPVEAETAASLSRVADNTATDEEVVRLARQGLVNIQEGQNVITPRGEEVMQRGGAPLPRLTPEERAAEIAAPAEPTISEIPKTSEIVGAEPAAIVEQEPVAPAEVTPTPLPKLERTTTGKQIIKQAEEGGVNLAEIDLVESAIQQIDNPESSTIPEATTAEAVQYIQYTPQGKSVVDNLRELSRSTDKRDAGIKKRATAILERITAQTPAPATTPAPAEVVTPAAPAPAVKEAESLVTKPASLPKETPSPTIAEPTISEAPSIPQQDVKSSRYGKFLGDSAPQAITEAKSALVKFKASNAGKLGDNPFQAEPRLRELKNTISLFVANRLSITNQKADEIAEQIILGKPNIVDKVTELKPIKAKELDDIGAIRSAITRFGYELGDKKTYRHPREGEAITPTPATPAAEPAGISVGNRVKTKTTPQSYVVEEVLPQSEREVELGEQYYNIKNERTGEVQTVEAKDITAIKKQPKRKGEAGGVIIPSRQDWLDFAENIYEAGMSFADWSKAMVARFGNSVKKALQQIWDQVGGFTLVGGRMLPQARERGMVQVGAGTTEVGAETTPETTAAPEPEAAPVEKVKRKTEIQSIIEATTGVKRPISRITISEMTALKEKIKTRARRRREDKRSQREFADELMKDIKEMTMRGKVRPTQLRAITSKALRTQFDNDKSIQNFIEYFGKVIENANYEADLKSARDAQKSASVYKKRKNIPGDQIEILDRISRAEVNLIDDPLEFATAARDFMKAFLPPISREYSVIPNKDMHSYLDEIQGEIDIEKERIQNETIQSAFEKVEKDEKLTRAEMKAYMGEKNYANYLEQQSEERRAKIEKAINSMANQSKQNLINYEPTDFTDEQMRIVKVLRKADVEGMSADQKREYIQFVDSIVANNTTYGAAKVAGTVEAIAGVNQWIKDKPNAAKGRAAFEVLEKVRTGLSTFGRSVPDIFRDIFKKTGALGQIQQRMGLYELTTGQVEANKIIDDIQKFYQDFYAENNKKYPDSMTKEALLAEGIASYLIQREPQTDDAQSVIDRIRKVQTAIDRWKGNPKTREHGEVAQVALDKLAANSSDEVLAKLKEQFLGNYNSLVWLRDKLLPKYKPMLKEFDENFQNQASNYDEPNYMPISYIKKFLSADRLNETNAAYDNTTFKITQIASSIKRKKMENIPKDLDLDLNIRRGVFNSLSESVSKAKTAPAWNKIISFLDAEKADTVFGTEENKQMVLNILVGLKTSRERRAYLFEAVDQLVDTFVSGTRTVASSLALGGITQPIRQLPEQLWSTAVNVGLFTLGKNIMPQSIKAAIPLLSRYSIGQRGDVRAGTKFINQAEAAYNRAEKYIESSKWIEGADMLSKANQVWMTPLTWADVSGARAAWMSYYQQYLKKEKIPFLGWDKEDQLIDTDPERQAAAMYAESITDIYQGASDPTRMALFAQRGKNAQDNLLKALFFSFNSFAVQAKSRFFSDARDIVSSTTDFEDKVSAARGLTATIGGMAIFAWVNAYVISAIYGGGVSLVYAMLGVDQDEPDEEEKKKDADFKWKKFKSKLMATFFMGGGGQFAEEGFIDLLNYASYFIESRLETEDVLNKDGAVMSYKTYERTNAPFWRYKAASTAPATLGLFEIPLGQVEKMHDIVVNTFDEDKFENLTEEEKRIISFNSFIQFLYVTRLLGDVDLSRISERAVKDVEKQAEEREKSQRELMRQFSR